MSSCRIGPHRRACSALTTTRRLPGNSLPPYDAFNLGLGSGEDESTVYANRALLQRAFALPSPPRWLRQVHGDRSLRLTAEIHDGEPKPTPRSPPNPASCWRSSAADCLPILVCAEDGAQIAAIHAGWRGFAGGVIESCIGRLRNRPGKLLAWLGPAIGPASYEVGDEVRAAFVERDEASQPHSRRRAQGIGIAICMRWRGSG